MPLPLPPGPPFGSLELCRRITVLIEPIVRRHTCLDMPRAQRGTQCNNKERDPFPLIGRSLLPVHVKAPSSIGAFSSPQCQELSRKKEKKRKEDASCSESRKPAHHFLTASPGKAPRASMAQASLPHASWSLFFTVT